MQCLVLFFIFQGKRIQSRANQPAIGDEKWTRSSCFHHFHYIGTGDLFVGKYDGFLRNYAGKLPHSVVQKISANPKENLGQW